MCRREKEGQEERNKRRKERVVIISGVVMKNMNRVLYCTCSLGITFIARAVDTYSRRRQEAPLGRGQLLSARAQEQRMSYLS